MVCERKNESSKSIKLPLAINSSIQMIQDATKDLTVQYIFCLFIHGNMLRNVKRNVAIFKQSPFFNNICVILGFCFDVWTRCSNSRRWDTFIPEISALSLAKRPLFASE